MINMYNTITQLKNVVKSNRYWIQRGLAYTVQHKMVIWTDKEYNVATIEVNHNQP